MSTKFTSFLPKSSATKIIGLERSFIYIFKRYKFHILASIIFGIVLALAFYMELGLSDPETYLLSLFTTFTLGTPSWITSFSSSPLSYLMVKLAPPFIAGVLITAATKFIKDIVGTEFELVRSANLSRSIIENSENHVIVLGLGRVGIHLSQILFESGIGVIGIDKDPSKLNTPLVNDEHGWIKFPKHVRNEYFNFVDKIPAILVSDDELSALESANLENALVLCLMSSNFEDNVFSLMRVKTQYPHITIIARAGDQKEMDIYDTLGVRYIEPKAHGAEEIFHMLEATKSHEIKVSGVVKQGVVGDFLAELESNKFNIDKFRRYQASSDYNYIQVTVEFSSDDLTGSRKRIQEISRKYFN